MTFNARLALAFALCLFSVNWTIRDLGTLPGGTESSAMAINNHGQIVGSARNASGQRRAVIFDTPLIEIPTVAGPLFGSIANDISDSGLIAGQAEREGFFLPPGGSLHLLGPDTGAYAVNEYGDVAGYGVFAYGSWQTAYVWPGATSPPVDLGHLGGTSSTTRDLSEYPLACGWSEYDQAASGHHAFLWYEGNMLDLGTLPGGRTSGADHLLVDAWPDYTFATVWVVGYSETASRDMHAVLWNAGVMTDLGVLPGHDDSRALWINRKHVAVGYSAVTGGAQRAVRWVDGAIEDLNDLLPPDSGWELVMASSINDRGQIVGSGLFEGKMRAFLLEP